MEDGSCMREIDWKRGNPYIWQISDLEYLKTSPKLFVRKFDMNIDKEIVWKIKELWGD